MSDRTQQLAEGPLAAASAGAVGGVTAMGVWEMTAAPGFVAALAAAIAGLAVFAAGTFLDRARTRAFGEDA